MSNSTLPSALPLLILTVTSVAVMIGIAIRRSHRAAACISLAGLAISFASLWPASSAGPVQITSLLIVDRYALVYMGLVLAASAAVILLSFPYLSRRPEHKEEFYLLLVLATLGSMVLAASNHMASLFLGLELLSISLYALISYPRTEVLPVEAGIKYLVLAASSSAFLLFGMALLYVAEGSMDFSQLPASATDVTRGGAPAAGIVLVLTGIGFKLAVVPFHLWTPDVYEGAPLPVAAFIATVSKGGVFAFLLRWLRLPGGPSGRILILFGIVAIASMLIGNLLALRQTNIKRLLAYSSIAHMGYFLVAAIAGGSLGRTAATYYLAAYMVTVLGAFGSLLALSSPGRDTETFDDIRGLFWTRPVVAAVFTAMILSLAGIPLTAGFLGKFYVLTAGASAGAWTLIVILILSSTIGLVYYLRVTVAMLTTSDGLAPVTDRASLGITPGIALTVLAIALLVLGVYPGPFWNAISAATGQQ
jgi:NADH-quinone oxidoreductase subunit N